MKNGLDPSRRGKNNSIATGNSFPEDLLKYTQLTTV